MSPVEQELTLRAALKCLDELEAFVAWLKTGYRVLDQPHTTVTTDGPNNP